LQKPLLARMSTIDGEATAHRPGLVQARRRRRDVIATRDTRKVGHIARNPKGAIAIGGDSGDGGGYLLKGEFASRKTQGCAG